MPLHLTKTSQSELGGISEMPKIGSQAIGKFLNIMLFFFQFKSLYKVPNFHMLAWEKYRYLYVYIYIYINFFPNILDIQDDEVAETVYRDRKRQLPLELIVELTEETFNVTVMASDSIVLFYAGCEYELYYILGHLK